MTHKTKAVIVIPNSEIRAEYVNAVSVSDWGDVSKALKNSADTLNAIWQSRAEAGSESHSSRHILKHHISSIMMKMH